MKAFTEENIRECTAAAQSIAEEINALPHITLDSLGDKCALVVVDIVNGFVREGAMAAPAVEGIIPNSAELVKRFCDKKMPVAAFADCHKKDCAEFLSFPEHCLDGTSESEIVDEIKAAGSYRLIKKNSTNGFHEKEFLDFMEENPDVETYVVIGDCTDICVMQFCLSLRTWFNCRDMKDKSIIVPVDCVETYDAPFHSGAFTNIAAYKLMKDSGVKFVGSIK